MTLPVYVYGMPVLRKKAAEIDIESEDIQKISDDMFETMYKADGVGLAGPQVGLSKQIFVIDATPMEEDDPSLKDFKRVFINPVILEEWGDEWEFNEGCLSIPAIRENVKRKESIIIQFFDQDGELKEEEFDGIKARIIQHEYDHLQGKLFVDRLPPIKRKLLNGKLNAISKGVVEVDYKIKYPGSK